MLVVTPGNEPLQVALNTLRTNELAEVRIEQTEYLTTAAYRTLASSGRLDLIVFDRCSPAEMPQANTWFIGAMPPGNAWSKKDKAVAPQILDADTSHPLMQLVEMSDVLIAEATPLTPPKPQRVLLESTAGRYSPLRRARRLKMSCWLGFVLVGSDSIGTNWPVRLSFPVFVMNLLEYFGPSREQRAVENVRPERSWLCRSTPRPNGSS